MGLDEQACTVGERDAIARLMQPPLIGRRSITLPGQSRTASSRCFSSPFIAALEYDRCHHLTFPGHFFQAAVVISARQI
jgi:hypothetical protein